MLTQLFCFPMTGASWLWKWLFLIIATLLQSDSQSVLENQSGELEFLIFIFFFQKNTWQISGYDLLEHLHHFLKTFSFILHNNDYFLWIQFRIWILELLLNPTNICCFTKEFSQKKIHKRIFFDDIRMEDLYKIEWIAEEEKKNKKAATH